MSDLLKIKICKVMAASNLFWMVTLVAYLQYRSLSLAQALQILSIYSILVVILEYPTGVIGDYFSHKISILMGSVIIIPFFALLTLPGNFYYYTTLFVMAALAVTFVSGSDTAFFHSISKDFKKDLAEITPYALIMATVNIAIGGLVASIDIKYPLYLSLIYAIPTLPLLLSIKAKSEKSEKGNIFLTASAGIKDIVSNPKLKSLIIISSVFNAFFTSIKWFYNPLFEKINLPVSYWGFIVSGAFLLIALGAQIYRFKSSFNLIITSIFSLGAIVLIGITRYWLFPLIGIWVTHIIRGYQDTHLGVEMNEAIKSTRRASILSFNSLSTRLLSALYISGTGFLLPRSSFFVVLSITAAIIAVVIFFPLRKVGNS